ncbi:hypothetical protein DRJ04_01545 [Candidatus Aerophobetes bacterium]|uniref:DUF5317 domain-containing protein n=1 Tax=Aerophobetes bacterium TaxID=2030807 RepID=A0A662DK08_UNCAE|nr:MAG: hypothetical protein DRJ04_01545 [Candidatus Aerophobetes bacterium]
MLLDVLVISLIIAFLRGGKLIKLAKMELHKIELIIIPFVLQYILVVGGERGISWFGQWGIYLHLFSYIILLAGIWYNRHIKEMEIFGVGILLNFLVIAVNKGQMPVLVEALKKVGMEDMLPLLQSKNYVVHTVAGPQTRLNFLADIIPLPPPYPRPRVLSIGDIVMGAGIFLLIQNYMVGADLFKIKKRRKCNGDEGTTGKNEENRCI